MWKKILHSVFPLLCIGCEKPLERSDTVIRLCENCLLVLHPIAEYICSACGRRLSLSSGLCSHGALPLFTLFPYTDTPIRHAIHELKYSGREKNAETLALLLWNSFEKELLQTTLFRENNFLCIPIPLFSSHERARGYNQSAYIAELFFKKLCEKGFRATYDPHLLTRTQMKKSQTLCENHTERKQNISGVFSASHIPHNTHNLVLLFDDVSTSGATIEEAARTLKKAGAPHCVGLVIAKA